MHIRGPGRACNQAWRFFGTVRLDRNLKVRQNTCPKPRKAHLPAYFWTPSPLNLLSSVFLVLHIVRLYSLYRILYPRRRIESYSILGTIVSPNNILLFWGSGSPPLCPQGLRLVDSDDPSATPLAALQPSPAL